MNQTKKKTQRLRVSISYDPAWDCERGGVRVCDGRVRDVEPAQVHARRGDDGRRQPQAATDRGQPAQNRGLGRRSKALRQHKTCSDHDGTAIINRCGRATNRVSSSRSKPPSRNWRPSVYDRVLAAMSQCLQCVDVQNSAASSMMRASLAEHSTVQRFVARAAHRERDRARREAFDREL